MRKVLEYLNKLWYSKIENNKVERGSVIMIQYDIRVIAEWLLSHEELTHKRLQKYLYFFYGEYLSRMNDDIDGITIELFRNDFEGWAHGPVSPTIYAIYKGSGYRPLMIHSCTSVSVSAEDNAILLEIYDQYKKYTTDQLESLSHKQSPWINSRVGLEWFDIGNRPLSTEDIFECFHGNNN